jgi:hypothetical protein
MQALFLAMTNPLVEPCRNKLNANASSPTETSRIPTQHKQQLQDEPITRAWYPCCSSFDHIDMHVAPGSTGSQAGAEFRA